MSNKKYLQIAHHYEKCFEKYGDTHKGVDWPKKDDVIKRFAVMLDLIHDRHLNERVSIVDLGCGTAHLCEYVSEFRKYDNLKYVGIDISDKFVKACKLKYPNGTFITSDILEEGFPDIDADYVIMNGLFTEKQSLSYDEMWVFFTRMVKVIFDSINIGLAFNVMSKHVDWEREDLFHVSFDQLAEYLTGELSKNFVFKNDYGLYEYTTYLYK